MMLPCSKISQFARSVFLFHLLFFVAPTTNVGVMVVVILGVWCFLTLHTSWFCAVRCVANPKRNAK